MPLVDCNVDSGGFIVSVVYVRSATPLKRLRFYEAEAQVGGLGLGRGQSPGATIASGLPIRICVPVY